jgi:hypothetical protein
MIVLHRWLNLKTVVERRAVKHGAHLTRRLYPAYVGHRTFCTDLYRLPAGANFVVMSAYDRPHYIAAHSDRG